MNLSKMTKAELIKIIEDLKNNISSLESKKTNSKKILEEDKNMFDMHKVFTEFGKVNDGELALTLNGEIAVQRKIGEYVRYNSQIEQIENQMDLVLKEAEDFIMIIPVEEINVGDIVKYKDTYYQVLSFKENGSLKVINIKTGTKSTIVKEVNILGFSFYYKVVCLFNTNNNSTIEGINPLMLTLLQDDKNSKDSSSLLPLLLMNSGNNNNNALNPMMMLLMSNKNIDIKDLLMFQSLNNNSNNNNINPLMLMMMSKDNDSLDIKTLMLMQMMGNKTNLFNCQQNSNQMNLQMDITNEQV